MPPETRTSLISLCLLNRTVVIAFFPLPARVRPPRPARPRRAGTVRLGRGIDNLQPNLRGTDSRHDSRLLLSYYCPPLSLSALRPLSRRHSHTDHSHTPFMRFTLPCYTANCVTVYKCTVLYGVAHRRSAPCFVLSLPSAMDASTALPRRHRVATWHTVRHGAAMTDKALAPRWLPRTSRGG